MRGGESEAKGTVPNTLYLEINIKQTGSLIFVDNESYQCINNTFTHWAGEHLQSYNGIYSCMYSI